MFVELKVKETDCNVNNFQQKLLVGNSALFQMKYQIKKQKYRSTFLNSRCL